MFLEISQNSQENTYTRVCLLIKLQAWGLQLYWKRDSGTGVFLWILRNFYEHFLYRTPPVAASETSKQGGCLLRGNYFHKKLHLRCLKRFWIRYCPVNQKKQSRQRQSCKAETNHMTNFKATYISVLNHWKTLETTLTTESNERNQMTYLQVSSSIPSNIFFD